MKKSGQISIFIIVGIIVVAIVAFFLYARSQSQPMAQTANPVASDAAPVKQFVETCLKQVGQNGLVRNSVQGGYYTNFEQETVPVAMAGNNYSVPLYFDGTKINIPSEEKMKKELESYVGDNLAVCLSDFSSLEGFTVEKKGSLSVKTMVIASDKVSISYEYPLMINGKTELKDFFAEHNVPFGEDYGLAKNLVLTGEPFFPKICMSCYADKSIANNVTFLSLSYQNYSIMVINDSKGEVPIYFAYGIKTINPLPGVQ